MFNFIDIIDGRWADVKIGCLANYFSLQKYFSTFLFFAGRISSLYRGSSSSCEDLCLHLVQPPGGEKKTFQETWKTNEFRRRETMQGRVDGEFCIWNIFYTLPKIFLNESCLHRRQFWVLSLKTKLSYNISLEDYKKGILADIF